MDLDSETMTSVIRRLRRAKGHDRARLERLFLSLA
jgi:hypothetical protein